MENTRWQAGPTVNEIISINLKYLLRKNEEKKQIVYSGVRENVVKAVKS